MTVDPRARWQTKRTLCKKGKWVRQSSSHASDAINFVSYCQQQSVFSRALGNTTHNCKSIKSMKRKKPKQSDTVWHCLTLSPHVESLSFGFNGAESVPNRYQSVPWTPRRRCTFSSSCWELHPEPMRSMSQYVWICFSLIKDSNQKTEDIWRHTAGAVAEFHTCDSSLQAERFRDSCKVDMVMKRPSAKWSTYKILPIPKKSKE